MALAGKFLSVFLFWCCAQAMLVMPGMYSPAGQAVPPCRSGNFVPTRLVSIMVKSLVQTALADPARPEAVRVLPDDFLSGNSDSARPDAENAKPIKPQADKPERSGAQVPFARPESAAADNAEAGRRDFASTGAGQPKEDSQAGDTSGTRQGASIQARAAVSSADVESVAAQAESGCGLTVEAGWDLMPAGARPAYMGIHGGTMPVSLLVSNDGNSLLTFVGRTGNDFLDMLRRTELPLPSLFNSTEGRLPVDFQAGLAGARVLSAGSGQYRMPVLCLSADAFARIAPTPDMLQPFGLSDKPLALEGEVLPPDRATPAKQFRMFFQPQYLQPKADRQ